MATAPVGRSYNQILGSQLNAFMSKQGVRGIKAGSPVLSFLEAASQSDFRVSQDLFQMLRARALDKAEGAALDKIGADEDVPRIPPSPASGVVTFTDTSFTKISTTIFQGLAAPIPGTTSLNVASAAAFPGTGSVYVGRGTANFEGPLAYTSATNNGSYWTLQLSAGTARVHNVNEPVTLAQGGDRLIGAGTVVQTALGVAGTAAAFATLNSAVIPDGETQVQNVQIVCQTPGTAGNVIAGAVSSIPSPPSAGITVTNPNPFSNGTPAELDPDYRERIRVARQSRVKGTPQALQTNAVGAVSPDEGKRVQSASYVAGAPGQPAALYIDDGTGYEEIFQGVAIESLTDQANGGEPRFNVAQRGPVTKACVVSTIQAPFAVSGGQELSVSVGGTATTHAFAASDFQTNGAATAYEIVASINADSNLLWAARTMGSGSQVVLYAKADSNEQLQVLVPTGTDANVGLGFPTAPVYTMKLYKNDRLLSKDGQAAAVTGLSFGSWRSMSGPQTLQVAVDGTPSYTATVTDAVFAATGTYTSVGLNSPAAWAAALNSVLPGATVTVGSNSALIITSNKGESASASISILGGTLASSANMFQVGSATGAGSDYVLDRNTGQITLAKPLAAGDRLTAGTTATRAFVQTPVLTTVVLSATGNLWFGVDAAAQLVSTGITSSSAVSVAVAAVERWGFRLRLSAPANSFTNVQEGDWIIPWDGVFNSTFRQAWRAINPTGTTIDVERPVAFMARWRHAAVKLGTGKILTTGGCTSWNKVGATNSASLFDPTTSLWTAAATMAQPRARHTATLLGSGKVLVVGGRANSTVTGTCEVYDPTGNTWTAAASLPAAQERYGHTATLLGDGTVLVAGGINNSGTYLATSYTYDPVGNAWTARGNMGTSRAFHAAALTAGGAVLAAGGQNPTVLASTEYYSAGVWTQPGNLPGGARQSGAISLRSDNKLMFTGGCTVADGGSLTASNSANVDVFTEGANTWAAGVALNNACSYHAQLKTTDNNVVVGFGGRTAGAVEVWTGAAWTAAASPLGTFQRAAVQAVEASANQVLFLGGADTDSLNTPAASMELYNEAGNTWSQPDAANLASTLTQSAGVAAARSAALLQQVQVASSSFYTATTLAPLVAPPGAFGSTYRTNSLRVTTDTYKTAPSAVWDPVSSGDVCVVAADAAAQNISLAVSSAVSNQAGQIGAVEAQQPDSGTPDFRISYVLGQHGGGATATVVADSGYVPATNLRMVHGRQRWDSSSDPTRHRWGTNLGFSHTISSATAVDGTYQLTLGQGAPSQMIPFGRAWFASPFAINFDDQLNVVVDGDSSQKRYSINMWRDLKPVNSTYSQQNTFRDADNGNASLASAFGTSYSFNDHVVNMRARALSNASDNARVLLWRYYRVGPDGNQAQVRFSLPTDANQAVGFSLDNRTTQYTRTSVTLASGAYRSPISVRSTTYVGVLNAAPANGFAQVTFILGFSILSASKATGVVTATLDIGTPGVTAHNIANGQSIWVQSNNANFPTGLYALTGTTSNTVTYNDGTGTTVGATANIGTASYDVAEATMSGSGAAAGDFFRIDSTASSISPAYLGRTARATAAGNQYITGLFEEWAGGGGGTTPTWYQLGIASAFKVFQNPAQSATTVAAAVNALYSAAASTLPVFPTVVGTGAGVLDRSTAEFENASPTYYQLADGVNYVQSTVYSSGDYQLTFKNPISSAFGTLADWGNETVKICPITTAGLVAWFQAPAVSALSSSAAVAASSRGSRPQISTLTPGSGGSVQVQGGTANSAGGSLVGSMFQFGSQSAAVLNKGDVQGLCAGDWVVLSNAKPLPRPNVFGAPSTLDYLDAQGNFRLDSGGYAAWNETASSPQRNVQLAVVKHNQFACLIATNFGTNPTFAVFQEGDWIRVSLPRSPTSAPQMPLANTGLFRVVRNRVESLNESTGCVWIENPTGVEVGAGECDLQTIEFASIMPGDVVHISTPLWGAANMGSWTVTSIGSAVSNSVAGGMTRAAGTVTVTTSIPHGLAMNDQFTVSPGEANFPAGTYSVASVIDSLHFTYTSAGAAVSSVLAQQIAGLPFQNDYAFSVSVASKATTPISGGIALGSQGSLVQVVEGSPSHMFKQITSIAPNATDPTGTTIDVKLDNGINYGMAGANAGTVMTALDKLGFPTTAAQGSDGYAHSVGLVGEVNRIMYGDPSNPSTYPGVAAAPAQLDIGGANILRVQVSLLLRTSSGNQAAVAAAVQSAVAAVVNQTAVGTPVALSDIVTAAGKVAGVVSVVILSPTYGAGEDEIPVQPGQKPRVLNLSDITVSFVGA